MPAPRGGTSPKNIGHARKRRGNRRWSKRSPKAPHLLARRTTWITYYVLDTSKCTNAIVQPFGC
eukprot:1102722-Pelagomonas_calceolata.AAC.1